MLENDQKCVRWLVDLIAAVYMSSLSDERKVCGEASGDVRFLKDVLIMAIGCLPRAYFPCLSLLL